MFFSLDFISHSQPNKFIYGDIKKYFSFKMISLVKTKLGILTTTIKFFAY